MGISTIVTAVFAVCAGLAANNLIMKKEKPYLYSKIGASGLFLVLSLVCWMESGNHLWLGFLPGYVLCAAGDILLPLSGEIRPSAVKTGKSKPSKYKKKTAEPEVPEVQMPPLRNPWFNLGVLVFALAHVVYIWQLGSLMSWEISPIWFVFAAGVTGFTFWTTRSSSYEYQGHGPVCILYSVLIGFFGGMGVDLLIRHITAEAGSVFGSDGCLMLAVGALFFMLSDALLATNYFKKKVWWMLGLAVMLFYYGAMYFLTTFTLYMPV